MVLKSKFNILKFQTLAGFKEGLQQTVQTQIRLLLKMQSDQGIPCLILPLLKKQSDQGLPCLLF